MNSLVLGLALSGAPATAAHPPHPFGPPPPVVVVSPYRPAYRGDHPRMPAYPPPAPAYPVFAPPVLPPVPAHPPMTVEHFAKCFQPTPGKHHVCLIHPVTCRPVEVCFTLPHGCGCPKVKVCNRSIEFDYGRKEVEINFLRNGRVDVDY